VSTPVRRVVANLAVADPQADMPFWTELLGLETAMDLEWVVNHRAAGASQPVQVQLVSRDATAPVDAAVSVEVDSPATVDALHARAVDSGLRVEHPPTDEPWGVRRFFVRTPGGVVVNVVAHA
jgi:catechol 2,3-dioxygenase-like lactoylglutathione lyase family enzyme